MYLVRPDDGLHGEVVVDDLLVDLPGAEGVAAAEEGRQRRDGDLVAARQTQRRGCLVRLAGRGARGAVAEERVPRLERGTFPIL